MATQETDIAIIKIPCARLSFPHLFTARAAQEGQEPKFSANIIMDNDKHGALLDQIEKTIKRVSLDFFKKDVKLRHQCLHDGNEEQVADKDGYGDGTSYIVASRKTRPSVVDAQYNPITEADNIIYAGCYVNASVRLYAYEHPTGGKGVSADLRAIQFVKDGESFGAGPINPEEEFKQFESAGTASSRSPGRSRSSGGKSAVDDY